jgi:hypothetical protein
MGGSLSAQRVGVLAEGKSCPNYIPKAFVINSEAYKQLSEDDKKLYTRGVVGEDIVWVTKDNLKAYSGPSHAIRCMYDRLSSMGISFGSAAVLAKKVVVYALQSDIIDPAKIEQMVDSGLASSGLKPEQAAMLKRTFIQVANDVSSRYRNAQPSEKQRVIGEAVSADIANGGYASAWEESVGEISDNYRTDAYAEAIGAAEPVDKRKEMYELAINISSPHAERKTAIIERLVTLANELLVKHGMPVEGATPEEKLKNLRAKIPPATRLDHKNHDEVCKNLALAINKTYGTTIIDPGLPTEEMCIRVSDMLGSLATGMSVEFYVVSASMRKNVKHLKVLLDVFETWKSKFNDELNAKGKVTFNTERLMSTFDMIISEIRRQIAQIETILSTSVSKAEEDTMKYLAEFKKLSGLIPHATKAEARRGFGSIIVGILEGIHATAHLGIIYKRALEKIGMSIDEFAKSQDPADIYKNVEEIIRTKKLSDEEIVDLTDAMEFLIANFAKKPDIVEAIRAKITGACAESHVVATGGDAVEKPPETTQFERAVDARSKARKVVISAFGHRLESVFKKLSMAIMELAKHVGKEIPIGDKTEELRTMIWRLNEVGMFKGDIYQILSGFYTDARTLSKRDNLIATMKMLVAFLDNLATTPEYSRGAQYIKAVSTAISELTNAVAVFETDIRERFGRTGGDEIEGGFKSLSRFDEPFKMSFDIASRLQESLNLLDHRVKVAHFLSNIDHKVEETADFNKKYETLLGENVAKRVYEIETAASDILKVAKENPKNPTTDDNVRNKFVTEYRDAMLGFWRAVQAMDLYLRDFTSGLMKNPGEIAEIQNALGDIVALKEWHDTFAGDNLAKVFERLNDTAAKIDDIGKTHYYEWLKTNTPKSWDGEYQLSVLDKVKTDLEAFFEGFRVLKNLISIFSRFGSKMKMTAAETKTLMTPKQLYVALFNFLVYSSMAIGLKTGADNKPDATSANKGIITPFDFKGLDKSVFNPKMECELFSELIKAMLAKVLTITGLFEMIHKPDPNPLLVNSIRVITGGGDEAIPHIEADYTELYFRLPLMAQFYNKFLDDMKSVTMTLQNGKNGVLRLMTDDAGVFGDLIRFFHLRFGPRKFETMTENELKIAIRMINAAAKKCQSEGEVTKLGETKAYAINSLAHDIIQKYVHEMNSRLGLVEKEAYNQYIYQQLKETTYGEVHTSAVNEKTAYEDILPDDGTSVFDREMPADRFILRYKRGTAEEVPSITGVKSLTNEEFVRQFRAHIITRMNAITEKSGTSLMNMIASTKARIVNARNDEERFKLVASAIRGSGMVSKMDQFRLYMFSETVMTGLGMLSAMYTIVKTFEINMIAVANPSIFKGVKYPTGGTPDTDFRDFICQVANLFSNGIDKSTADFVEDLVKKLAPNYNGAADEDVEKMDKVLQVSNDAALHIFFESLATFIGSMNKLVSVSLDGANIIISFGPLQEYVESMLDQIHYWIDTFRPFVDPVFLSTFEEKERIGSLYWLTEQWREKLFTGRYVEDKTDAIMPGKEKYFTLAELTRAIPAIYSGLVRKAKPEEFSEVIERIVANDSYAANGGFDRKLQLFEDADVVTNAFDGLLLTGVGAEKFVDLRFVRQIAQFRAANIADDQNDSLLFAFNKMLVLYLKQFYDGGSKRIYDGLTKFAQGALHRYLANPQLTYPNNRPLIYVNNPGIKEIKQLLPTAENFDKNIERIIATIVKNNHFFKGFGLPTDRSTNRPVITGVENMQFRTVSLEYNNGGAFVPASPIKIPNWVAGLLMAWMATDAPSIDELRSKALDLSDAHSKFGPASAFKLKNIVKLLMSSDKHCANKYLSAARGIEQQVSAKVKKIHHLPIFRYAGAYILSQLLDDESTFTGDFSYQGDNHDAYFTIPKAAQAKDDDKERAKIIRGNIPIIADNLVTSAILLNHDKFDDAKSSTPAPISIPSEADFKKVAEQIKPLDNALYSNLPKILTETEIALQAEKEISAVLVLLGVPQEAWHKLGKGGSADEITTILKGNGIQGADNFKSFWANAMTAKPVVTGRINDSHMMQLIAHIQQLKKADAITLGDSTGFNTPITIVLNKEEYANLLQLHDQVKTMQVQKGDSIMNIFDRAVANWKTTQFIPGIDRELLDIIKVNSISSSANAPKMTDVYDNWIRVVLAANNFSKQSNPPNGSAVAKMYVQSMLIPLPKDPLEFLDARQDASYFEAIRLHTTGDFSEYCMLPSNKIREILMMLYKAPDGATAKIDTDGVVNFAHVLARKEFYDEYTKQFGNNGAKQFELMNRALYSFYEQPRENIQSIDDRAIIEIKARIMVVQFALIAAANLLNGKATTFFEHLRTIDCLIKALLPITDPIIYTSKDRFIDCYIRMIAAIYPIVQPDHKNTNVVEILKKVKRAAITEKGKKATLNVSTIMRNVSAVFEDDKDFKWYIGKFRRIFDKFNYQANDDKSISRVCNAVDITEATAFIMWNAKMTLPGRGGDGTPFNYNVGQAGIKLPNLPFKSSTLTDGLRIEGIDKSDVDIVLDLTQDNNAVMSMFDLASIL